MWHVANIEGYVDNGWPKLSADEHAVTELVAPLAGALSPYGDSVFPVPYQELPFVQSKTVINS